MASWICNNVGDHEWYSFENSLQNWSIISYYRVIESNRWGVLNNKFCNWELATSCMHRTFENFAWKVRVGTKVGFVWEPPFVTGNKHGKF